MPCRILSRASREPPVRWLAASGLLLGVGLGLMWAGDKISVDRLLDALDDAMAWEDDEVLSLA